MPIQISIRLTNGLPNVVPAWVRVEQQSGVQTQMQFTLADDLMSAGYCLDSENPITISGADEGQFELVPGWSATQMTLVDSDSVAGTYSYVVTLQCPTGKFIIDPQIINEP
jgi:hypothetical protein